MTEPLIRLEGLERVFLQGDDRVTVLKGIDLEIVAGEFVALVGTSGSGKSTLLYQLGLLDRPSGGRYWLHGRDVAGLPEAELARLRNRTFGFIFQAFHLVPYATALDNVLLPGLYAGTPGGALRRRGLELLEQVGLADRADFRPGQLSGGQQQRVALARALLNHPEVILADEPTGQLDSATSGEIMDLLSAIHRQGVSVILVTHDSNIAARASRRIRMNDGRIVVE